MSILNKQSYIPYYVQIKHILLERIRDQVYPERESIPSEYKLSREFEVTRMTIRKALDELKRDGILRTERGKGSIVAARKIEQSINHLYRFGVEVGDTGEPAISDIIEAVRCRPQQDVYRLFDRSEGEEFFRIIRLRHNRETPLSLEYIYIPCDRAPELLSHLSRENSVIDVLERIFGILIERATEYLTPRISDEYESGLLTIELHSPVFQTERITRTTGGEVIEFRRSVIRGDIVTLRAELPR